MNAQTSPVPPDRRKNRNQPLTNSPPGQEATHASVTIDYPGTEFPACDRSADATVPPDAAGHSDTVADDRRAPAGYVIEKELGRGGMGVVYLARDVRLQRRCALKMILSGAHSGAAEVERFKTEAKAIARLQHPGIVQVFEIGEHDGRPFMALEYCGGGSLDRLLRKKPLKPEEAAALVKKLAEAMQAAHEAKVIHRDLKPGNILLTNSRHHTGSLEPKISDFGLAKKLDEDRATRTGSVMGTPSYMPPEQAEGSKEVGPAADIYALGAILYECLTGRPPFCAATALDTLLQVVNGEPVPLRRLNPKVSRDLETIAHKCLQKDPRKRYAKAQDLADDLARYLAGEPILARPVRMLERLVKWVRRRPVVAALLATVALVTVGGLTSFLWAFDQALRARQAAIVDRDRAVKAENEAREQLWHSLLAQAQARRWSQRPGRRWESLEALQKAAAIRPSRELRNELIACLALTDLRLAKEWYGFPPGATVVAFDFNLEHYARGHDNGEITIRRVDDDQETARLPGFGVPPLALRFSPDGQFLAAIYSKPGNVDMNFRVWDLRRKEAIINAPNGAFHYAVDFRPDSRQVAAGRADGTVMIYALPTGKEEKLLERWQPPHSLAFHPTQQKIAVSSLYSQLVSIRDLETGRLETGLPHPQPVRGLAWRSDGQFLATDCADSRVYVWDLRPLAKKLAPTAKALEGHEHVVVYVAFNSRGDLLASNSWDGTVRLWDPFSGKQLISTQGTGFALRFSSDDRYLGPSLSGSQLGYWEAAVLPEYRVLPKTADTPFFCSVEFSPDGRLLAWVANDGTHLVDLAIGKEVALLPGSRIQSAFFHPDGKNLLTTGDGLCRWPITVSADRAGLFFGPRQVLDGRPHGLASLSRDGSFLVAEARAGALGFSLKAPGQIVPFGGLPNLRFVAVSPDGRWVAAGTWHEKGVRVWDARTGKVIRDLPSRDSTTVAFSPDGKWLVLSTGEDFRFWQTDSWQESHRVLRERTRDLPGAMAFSPQGDLLAITKTPMLVQLIAPDNGQEIATLESPHLGNVNYICFSPDGSQLAVSAGNVIHLWDLRRLRQRLAAHQLDWDLPSYPSPLEQHDMKPLQVKVQP